METRQLGFTEKKQRVGDTHLCTWEIGECLAIQDWCPQASDIIPPVILNPPPSQASPNGKVKHLLHTDPDSDGQKTRDVETGWLRGGQVTCVVGESCGNNTQWAGGLYCAEISSLRGKQTHTQRCLQDGETDTPTEPYVAGHTHPQGFPMVPCWGF